MEERYRRLFVDTTIKAKENLLRSENLKAIEEPLRKRDEDAREVSNLTTHLLTVVQESNEHIQSLDTELETSKSELEKSKSELGNNTAELETTRTELVTTKGELESIKEKAGQHTKASMDTDRSTITRLRTESEDDASFMSSSCYLHIIFICLVPKMGTRLVI